jgi:hypothetical protein
MVIINPIELLNIEDLSKESNVTLLINKIDIGNDCEVKLDIRKCYIDYPTTGKILDSILKQISSISGHKSLIISYDFHLPEYDLLACLFDECNFFDDTNFKELSLNDIKSIIETKLVENNISIIIELYKLFKPEKKLLKYGIE